MKSGASFAVPFVDVDTLFQENAYDAFVSAFDCHMQERLLRIECRIGGWSDGDLGLRPL